MGNRPGHRTGGGLSPDNHGSRYLQAGASVTRGRKGHSSTRAKGLENIYLKKFNKSRAANLNQTSGNMSVVNARRVKREHGRPMMYKFEDEPAELICDTEMN